MIEKNEISANRATAKVMRISAVVLTVVLVLNIVGIFIVDMTQMIVAYITGMILLLMPTLLVNILKKSDKQYTKYIISACAIIFTGIFAVILPKHAILLYVYPIAISSLYFSGSLNIFSTILTIIAVSAAQLISFYIPCDSDANFTDLKSVVLFGIVPRAMILFAIAMIFTMLCKRTASMLGSLMSAEQQERIREKSAEISGTLVKAVAEMDAISAQSAESSRTVTGEAENVMRDSEANFKHIQSVSENMSMISDNLKTLAAMGKEIERLLRHSEEVTAENENTLSLAEKGMQDIYSCTDDIKRMLSELSAQSKQISEIIKLIENISLQTDILAINASIEAAHAGTAGKGFAIVAGEIHTLSNRTKKSARDISSVLSEITANISEVARAMENNFSLTRSGMENMDIIKNSAGKISESNIEISRNVGHIAELIADVARNGDEVKNRLVNVSDNIEGNCAAITSVSEAIGRNTNSMETLTVMVKEIREISEQLSTLAG